MSANRKKLLGVRSGVCGGCRMISAGQGRVQHELLQLEHCSEASSVQRVEWQGR